jgi:hypothetical protein
MVDEVATADYAAEVHTFFPPMNNLHILAADIFSHLKGFLTEVYMLKRSFLVTE